MRSAERALHVGLEAQRRRQVEVLRCVEHLPGRDECARRQRGETCGQRCDLGREGSVVDTLPDQAEPDRVLGAELVA